MSSGIVGAGKRAGCASRWVTCGFSAMAMLTAWQADAAPPRFALGVAPVFELRHDYGNDTRFAFSPEVVGQTYVSVWGPRWFLRPGVRLGLDNLLQAEMPTAVQVTERGLAVLGELAILFDGPVVPALALGGGMIARRISFDVQGAVAPPRQPSHLEWLATGYAQLGLGIPVASGALVLEPFVRAQVTVSDQRSLLRFGLDATVAF